MEWTPDPNSTGVDLGLRSAVSLSDELAAGNVSSEELLAHFVGRHERLNPKLNAVVTSNIEQAVELARASDTRRARGEALGPMDGLPITVKDTFQVVGMTATAGATELGGFKPKENAVEVQRLLDAGAVIFGKTNVPRFAIGFESYNDLYGTTNNPWDTTRTPGGSAGGSACSTAAGARVRF
ncbi:MAG: amidase family protein [Pseudomonadota bacterium]